MKTEFYFSFDTEDFTSNVAADAIRDEARILHENGIRGNFNIVGFLARELVRNRRIDVLDELKNHTVSFHSRGHSYHPTINEYTDIDDYAAARAELERQESEGLGMVRAATGVDGMPAACPPGTSLSYVAMYAYADWGIPLYVGSLFNTKDGSAVCFCNGLHTNYDFAMESGFFDEDFSVPAFLDRAAKQKRFILYNHPNRVLFSEFWDMHNYYHSNQYPMHQWVEPPRYTAEQTARFYANLRALIAALKADDRFVIRDTKDLAAEFLEKSAARRVTRAMLPAIRDNLRRAFTWMDDPQPLSVADCFFAAKHFMTEDADYQPGFVHGFLETPVGASAPLTLTKAEVRDAAAFCSPSEFLPASFTINGKTFGPADLLFAMLDVAFGAETVQILPKEQQCDYSRCPGLVGMHLKGCWVDSLDFEDNYLSDRARLQAWTIRSDI